MQIYFDKNNLKAAEDYLVSQGAATANNVTEYLERRIRALLKENSSTNNFYVVFGGCGFFLGPSQLEQENSPSIDVEIDKFKQANGEATTFASIDFWLYA